MVGNENAAPNSLPDPMAMLFAAQRETKTKIDEKVAVKVALEMQMKEQEEQEHLKAVLAIQSEEDEAALAAAAQEKEDLRLAKLAQEAEEKQAKEDEARLASQLSEDEKLAAQMNKDLFKQLRAAVSKGELKPIRAMLSQLDLAEEPLVPGGETCLLVAVRSHPNDMDLIEAVAGAKGCRLDALDGHGFAALHRAAQNNRCDMIDVLVGAGATVDVRSEPGRHTPLMAAALAGQGDPIVRLIKHGGDLYAKDGANKMAVNLVSILNRSLKGKLETMMGWEVLEASRKGKADSVMSLVERGASVYLSDDKNMTSLHHACAGGHNMICEYLLNKRANPNAVDVKGETPLFKAAQAGSGSVWTTLIKHGANAELKDVKGLKAADHCNANVPLTTLILSSKRASPKTSPSKPSPTKGEARKGASPPSDCSRKLDMT